MIPGTIDHQGPLSMEFSRKEYWNWLPFPTPEDLPDAGIKAVSSVSPALADGFYTTAPPGKPKYVLLGTKYDLLICNHKMSRKWSCIGAVFVCC